ncbi:hypothetical protein AL540_019065 [Vibrio harveyi]|nr:hypothetical protein AL540_019065 [Vibrio harveyi]SQA40694.1 Uncharacterised protein [Vibrio harveyi]
MQFEMSANVVITHELEEKLDYISRCYFDSSLRKGGNPSHFVRAMQLMGINKLCSLNERVVLMV